METTKVTKQQPYDTNKVTNVIKGQRVKNLNVNHRKEGNPRTKIQVYLKRTEARVISVEMYEPKVYRTGMERVHACVWVRDAPSNTYLAGSGWAAGCGYHKTSAAIDEAVRAAGIEMYRFHGCGDSTVRVALKAIMSALGYRRRQYLIVGL